MRRVYITGRGGETLGWADYMDDGSVWVHNHDGELLGWIQGNTVFGKGRVLAACFTEEEAKAGGIGLIFSQLAEREENE